MIFNRHSALAGNHALLSASKYHWLGYDEAKLERYFHTSMQAAKGTRLHDLAATLIREGVKLPRNTQTLNQYVNDAIGYRMVPEQLLFYSPNAFGTPDAISFSDKTKTLRISDLKTGSSPTSEKQLLVYAAFFFLEYADALRLKVSDCKIELRIYQNDEVRVYDASPEEVMDVMDTIRRFDLKIQELREVVQ